MLSFTELLTASDSDLVKVFYKVKTSEKDDFIIRINNVAQQLGLNHTQLICALGFNKHIRDLTDIHSILGFRSYRILSYRTEELFTTDTYKQLDIDNILDIYSEHIEDADILAKIKSYLGPRLNNIQNEIDAHDDPSQIISYRMEMHAIYSSGIADQEFAEQRIKEDIGRFRILSNETNLIIEAGYFPPSNLFFQDNLYPDEKRDLIENKHIDESMIRNRLQNGKISEDERAMLEDYI